MTKKIKFTKTKKITIIKNSKGEVVSVNYINKKKYEDL